MNFRIAFAPARLAARTLAMIAATATFAVVAVAVHAQTPPPAAPPAAPAKKAQPKQPPAKQPAQAPAPAPGQAAPQPGAQPPAAAGQPQQIPLVYSAWVKLCGKNPQDPSAKELCQTMKEAHMESGQFVAAAALIEMAGEQKKILQLILPTRLLLPP